MNQIEMRDWDHFREYIADSYRGETNFLFRGQADSSWKIESTLTRLNQKNF
jgi:hypothetical protein